jgi:peptidoglycan hydrolase-like protein with peptidoglycan-binding domain
MRKILAMIVLSFPAIALLSGCVSTGSKDIGSLHERVSALEERQDAIESRARSVSTEMTYVSAVERPAPVRAAASARSSSASMTKKELQTALKNAGYYDGAIDGKIGPRSRKAITDFQAANKLKVDGVVGPQTRAALSKYLN